MEERIQKVIANRGYCSRRKAEELIQKGLVKVNGKTASLGLKVSLDANITIDGTEVIDVKEVQGKVYLALNKPLGVLSTVSDDRKRKTVIDLIDKNYKGVYPVGRLDINSTGLLFLTNDGKFAQLVMHPSSSLPKTYLATVKGYLDSANIRKLERGVMLEDGLTAPAKLEVISVNEDISKVFITIHEGRNRQVRRMFNAIEHDVLSLKRVSIGPYTLPTNQKPGEYVNIPLDIVEKIIKECEYNKAHNTYIKEK